MARWFLSRPSEHTNSGEIKVANYLKKLPDSWTVVWGFFYEDRAGVHREGDFLILAPFAGVLVLEVKGGVPRHFGPTGEWEGPKNDNPVNQLDTEWWAVLRRLKGTDAKSLYVAKALGLPGVTADPNEERVHGIERGLTITSNEFADLKLLSQAFRRLFQRAARGGEVRSVSVVAKEAFITEYAQGIEQKKLSEFTDHTEERFRQQMVAEYRMLDMLRGNQQLLVQGGCGSGKSWYALEQARRYAEEGKRVLFLVYNRAVTQVMRDDAKRSSFRLQEEIVVKNFEELAAYILGESVDAIQPPDNSTNEEVQKYYEENLPAQVIEAMGNASRLASLTKYDALVVDEGQDHDTNLKEEIAHRYPHITCGWWSIYWQLLVNETESPMVIFYDTSQRPIFRRNTDFEPDKIKAFLSQPVYVNLSRTLRYTRPVYEFLMKLQGEGTMALVEALCDARELSEGPEVITQKAEGSAEELCKQLGVLIEEWEESGLCEAEDVMILHARSNIEDSSIGATQWVGSYKLTPVGEEGMGVRVCSIHKAKGLDAKAVILVDLSTSNHEEMSAYERNTYFMGASRARQMLAVIS